jgi:hypothetical protein
MLLLSESQPPPPELPERSAEERASELWADDRCWALSLFVRCCELSADDQLGEEDDLFTEFQLPLL